MIDLNNYLTEDLSYLSNFQGLKNRALKYGNSLDQIASSLYRCFLTKDFTQNQLDNLSPFCRTLFNCLSKESKKLWMNNFFELWDNVDDDDKETLLSIIFHTERGDEIFNKLSPVERVQYSSPWLRPMIKLSNTELFPRLALLQLWEATPKEAKETLFNKIMNDLKCFNCEHSVSLSELLKDQDFIKLFKSQAN